MRKYYNYIDFYNQDNDENLTIIPHFKTYLQTTKSTCGPACILMILNNYGDFSMTEMEISEAVGCKIPGGVGIKELSEFLENRGYKVKCSINMQRDDKGKIFSRYNDFKMFVIKSLKNKMPILIENVDLGGHYKLIIGYDCIDKTNPRQDILIFADPAENTNGNKDGFYYDSAYRFYMSWFDDHHLPKDHKIQPFLVAEPLEK